MWPCKSCTSSFLWAYLQLRAGPRLLAWYVLQAQWPQVQDVCRSNHTGLKQDFSRACKTCRGAIRAVQAISGTIHKFICLPSVPQILSVILISNRISSVTGTEGSTGYVPGIWKSSCPSSPHMMDRTSYLYVQGPRGNRTSPWWQPEE